MYIQLNGKKTEYSETTSISDILSDFKLMSESVVIEYNRILLSETDSINAPLVDGDSLEIVRFVGGG
ncbi:sulfur carrier protein ThiS [Desulfotalea psychrophila]|uniref:Thiamine biosynthesis protein ThiS n=1 Tax=Desulfotalea psychrophila (strain LSv54 / DSM 12343) TaxID=177439 RepID=Q6AMF8_DESPS|nr:sulfur carrier protein ThiS [Desulfotalea psychrophila]CAG36467.1 hypothetical protein DP1738 [Desulfotalea psychrophila LSv54]